MKLVAHFPEYSSLSRAQLGVSPTPGRKRLTLAIPHIVSGTVATKERIGSADIHYNLDFDEVGTFNGKMKLGGGHFIGVQSVDYLHAQLQELRPRTAYAVEHVSNGKFDMRAVLYCLGAGAAGGAGPCTFETPRRPSAYKTLSTGWMVPNVGEITFGPNIVQTADQFCTLLAITGAAGVENVTFLTDFIPGTRGNMLTGRALSKFCYRVALNILETAHECICYSAHRVAFECGKSSVMHLNAHSDEGGWIRKMLASPSYPPSVGIVSGMGREFLGMPLQESIDPNETLRVAVAGFLEVVALLHPADVIVHGSTSFYDKVSGGEGRPSDFGLFVCDAHSVLLKWRDLISDLDGLHHDSTSDIGAWQGFFSTDAQDRHFEVDVFIPWWWVETAPLLMSDIAGYDSPAAHGEVRKLPMFATSNVYHDSPVMDGKNRCMPGSKVWVERNPTTFRAEGASYLMSSAYNLANGLGQFVLSNNLDDTASPPLAFVDQSATNVADMRWNTPHNPMAHPLEGLTDMKSTFLMRPFAIEHDLTVDEIDSGVVESRLGRFVVVSNSPAVLGSTHRDVPQRIRAWLKKGKYAYGPISKLRIISVRAAPAATLSAAGEQGVDDPRGDAIQTNKTSDPSTTEPAGDPVSVSGADGGVKPTLPTVRTSNLDDRSGNGDGDTA